MAPEGSGSEAATGQAPFHPAARALPRPELLYRQALAGYGTDANGLVCGYRFMPGQPGVPLGSEEALPWLQRPAGEAGEGFVWLHFNLSHAKALPWLRAHAGLPESWFEALHALGSRSTRIERDGHNLLAVLNDVTFDFSFDPNDVATLWVHLGPRLVVSARRQPLRAVDRLRADVNRGEPVASTVALLEQLLGDQADELQRIHRAAADRVDEIEDELLAHRGPRHAGELARLRRLTVRLQRLLAPEPTALLRLLSAPPRWMSAEERELLRHAGEDFAVVLRDVLALQERIKLLQDETATHVAEQNNRSLFTLTMVTVLALPINLAAGLMGMNVGGIPLAGHGHGFWIMVALITAFTAVLALMVVRRLRRAR
ncbi:transporter [Azohydromonas caseinilytica]|uniref:Transporter n=1 Tax=Azohydromonas caseinilytica TaxID=2728836 RepID=A0A848FEB6_9BURK|nr:transporter [Azohydromonas caseinilytica]NML17748.1 transporter [Azohydromonas caseinilytica]